jgi:GntR family transcriptional regulator/MocR family aminotransferase
MEIHVSLIGRRNLSREIYRQLRESIMEGRLRAGDALPPTREMAQRLGVARSTVMIAYDRLLAEGFISARVGAGTFVSALPNRASADQKRPAKRSVLAPRPVWDTMSVAFAQPVTYDFRSGHPDATFFPHDTWDRLLRRALRSSAVASGIYGHPAGLDALREAIARHVGISRGVVCSADDVTITNGTQQAVDVVARVLLAPGDRAAVEDPGYRPIRWLLTSLGVRVACVPVDRDGLVVDKLPRGTRLVHVTPSHHYPLGVSMSLARRLDLLAWAERTDAAIVEDDYDSEFRFDGRPIEPLQALDTAGRVIYVGTFSKTLLPALRLGFVVTPPSLREAMHSAKYVADCHASIPAQVALARFIDEGHFARHIRKMSAVYRERHKLVTECIARDFAERLEVVPSSVGLHFAALARRASAPFIDRVVQRALARGVGIYPLARFAVHHPAAGLIIAYGAIPTALVDEGLSQLRRAFDQR